MTWFLAAVTDDYQVAETVAALMESPTAFDPSVFSWMEMSNGDPAELLAAVRFTVARGPAWRITDGTRTAGMIGLHSLDGTVARCGTWLLPEFFGRGVNAAAKRLLLDEAFGGYGLSAVRFRIHAGNGRSRSAIHKLGAVLVHEDSEWTMWEITAEEWPRLRK